MAGRPKLTASERACRILARQRQPQVKFKAAPELKEKLRKTAKHYRITQQGIFEYAIRDILQRIEAGEVILLPDGSIFEKKRC